jgi:hypothetical protein
MARTTEQDQVRELQRTLYRAAKADSGRRFHVLYDKVHRRDVLERAWELVRANHGAAGIDQQAIEDIERYGVSRMLDELATELRKGRWGPLPAVGSSCRRPVVWSCGRSRFPRSVIVSCRRRRSSSSNRCSRLTSCRARSGFARGARRTTRFSSSSTSPGEAGAGWSKRTSPTVMRRSRLTG